MVRLGRDFALAGSLARGWRPPNAFELFARGEHSGVAAFQLGNPDLAEESNVNGEIGLRYEGRRLRGRVSAYRNQFDDYIYLADTGEVLGALPVFVHRQADARIQGLEASLEAGPKSTATPLPQTPPDRVLASVRVEKARWGRLSRAFLGVEGAFVGEGVVSGPDEPLGTPTDAYELLDLRAGVAVPAGRTEVAFDLTVRNLLDTEYKDFLWSYKPFAPNPGRDVRAVLRVAF